MKLKKYVVASVKSYDGIRTMLLTREEYRDSPYVKRVVCTTDDFDEAKETFNNQKQEQYEEQTENQ